MTIDPTRLWRRYLLALGIVLAMLGTSHVAAVTALHGGTEAAAVINISGRQRMLSQRILYFAARHRAAGPEDPSSFAPLVEAIDLFAASHAALTRGGAMGLTADGAAKRAPVYGEGPGERSLDAMSRHYVADARTVAASEPGADAAWDRMQVMGPDELLRRLNEAVGIFEEMSKAGTATAERVANATFVLALLVLLAEALLIFLPAQRAVKRSHVENVAARERAEHLRTEAETARERLTAFVRRMSHELRTPSTG